MHDNYVDKIKEKLSQRPSREFSDERPQYDDQHMDHSRPYFDDRSFMEQLPQDDHYQDSFMDMRRERFDAPLERPYERPFTLKPPFGTEAPFGSEVPFGGSMIIDPVTLDPDLRMKLNEVRVTMWNYKNFTTSRFFVKSSLLKKREIRYHFLFVQNLQKRGELYNKAHGMYREGSRNSYDRDRNRKFGGRYDNDRRNRRESSRRDKPHHDSKKNSEKEKKNDSKSATKSTKSTTKTESEKPTSSTKDSSKENED